jgi:hypothetical protein
MWMTGIRDRKKKGLISFDLEVEEIQNTVWEKKEREERKMRIKRRGKEKDRKEEKNRVPFIYI